MVFVVIILVIVEWPCNQRVSRQACRPCSRRAEGYWRSDLWASSHAVPTVRSLCGTGRHWILPKKIRPQPNRASRNGILAQQCYPGCGDEMERVGLPKEQTEGAGSPGCICVTHVLRKPKSFTCWLVSRSRKFRSDGPPIRTWTPFLSAEPGWPYHVRGSPGARCTPGRAAAWRHPRKVAVISRSFVFVRRRRYKMIEALRRNSPCMINTSGAELGLHINCITVDCIYSGHMFCVCH